MLGSAGVTVSLAESAMIINFMTDLQNLLSCSYQEKFVGSKLVIINFFFQKSFPLLQAMHK